MIDMKAAINTCFILAAMMLMVGCGTSSSQPETALPDLRTEITHLTSWTWEFLPQVDGQAFAHTLGYSNVDSVWSSAIFKSDWELPGFPLEFSAYCLYRLELLDSLTEVKLELDWDGSLPENAWVALANWDTLTWDWFDASSAETFDIVDPAQYRDEENRCYAAVVVLSRGWVLLETIGISGQGSGNGYTLFAPLKSTETFLIDMDGTVVHTWDSGWSPGNSVELTEDGYLLRTCNVENPDFTAGGTGGRIEVLDWESNVIWSYELSSPNACQHHDFELLPSGNILLVVWQKYSEAQAIAAGRNPSKIGAGELWVDSIIEIEPVGASGGNIVWEWYLWDHLVQDFDSGKANFGIVADHPELVDFNFGGPMADWNHVNSVAYNAELDQVILSSHNQNELWVIDHSTTTAQAASHSGGTSGLGGDLLYRWGNQQTYGAGDASDQVFFGQHNIQWIEDGLRGAGHLLLYNNGQSRPAGNFSNIIELEPLRMDGVYRKTDGVWEPQDTVWEYVADPATDFFSGAISGVQRLPGGNTLICEGNSGRMFEVDLVGDIRWEYQNTVGSGPGGASVFRCTRYSPNYPGLIDLTP